MAKTLVDFRAEKGLYLKDVAAETGIPEEELKAVEESGTVPPHIAQKLIDIYYLPDTYFAEIVIQSKIQPKSPMKYFFGVSFVYSILTGIVVSIPMFIKMICVFIISFAQISQNGVYTENTLMDSPIFSVFSSIWTSAVYIISCIMFANFILKRTNYTGDIRKYQFLHYAIPSGVIAAISMASAYMREFAYYMKLDEDMLLGALGIEAIGLVLSLAVTLISVYVSALLLKTAIEEDKEKKFKTLKTLAIIVTVSSVIAYILTIISYTFSEFADFFVLIRRIFIYGLYIAVAWAVALTKTHDEKKNKIVFTILPLVSILQSIVLSIIGEFIG